MEEWKKVRGDVKRWEKEGDSIEGELVNVRDGQYYRQDGSKSKVYDIMTDKGAVTVFGSPVLERQMGSVKIGDHVRIVFRGKVRTKGGREANNFDVFVKE